ncbi:hypothetical protein AAHH67_15740 [Niallia circulans]
MDLIQKNTGWSESVIRSFSVESLKEIYSFIVRKQFVTKARITYTRGGGLRLHLPKKIREILGLKPGSRFGIKTTVNKEVALDTESEKLLLKMTKGGKVSLPLKLIDRKIIREVDDVLIRVVHGKIVFKSFTYYQ